ncbi:IS1634 family transposase [Patescibacteria group bacterium]|nr:IS1634 family transposase [Patescibacteria group bacterium]MBU1935370.1 IS1634 family transposase [Patescibacteria group bacterium]
MSSKNSKKISRQYVGEIPILQNIANRLGIKEILSRDIPLHRNEKVPPADSLMLLIYNITCGRQPLYELEEWVAKMQPDMFGYTSFEKGVFNDDRFGRALDKLYQADRASLMTEIVVNTIKTINLKLDQLHNDSTTVKAFGKIPGKTSSGLELKRGNSKDHRPDLKQLVYCLTVSADGFVPIHYKTYPGNTTDDTTHIDTWNTLTNIIGKKDFLYVADCKVCTDKQLSYIVSQNGKALTIIPETWSEVQQFKDELRRKAKKKKIIMRRRLTTHGNKYDTFSFLEGTYKTQKRSYTIFWIHSSQKKAQDFYRRQVFLQQAEKALQELSLKLNKRNLKSKNAITQTVNNILNKYKVTSFYNITIHQQEIKYQVQAGRGRPGPNTKYQTVIENHFTLCWHQNKRALSQEKNVDGIFPLLCTDKNIDVKSALAAYKYQPRLEKRFTQFKSIHNAAPLLFKNIERVEAMMFLFFIALMIQAVIEREVRMNMKKNAIDKLALYPEHRLSYHPTTAKIFDRFCDVSTYLLYDNNNLSQKFADSLNQIQLTILKLLNISEKQYWSN